MSTTPPDIDSHDASPAATRRQLVFGAGAVGLTALVLPSGAMASSVGGTGGGATYLNATTFTPEDDGEGSPIAGDFAFEETPPRAEWRIQLYPNTWQLPLLDSGVMTNYVNSATPPNFSYTYEVSFNNQSSWHVLGWLRPSNFVPYRWTVFVPYTEVPKTTADTYTAPTPPGGVTWNTQLRYVTKCYLRVLDGATVIDLSPEFYLW